MGEAYDRYRYANERRATLEKWAEVLNRIVEVKPAPTHALAQRTRRANVQEFGRLGVPGPEPSVPLSSLAALAQRLCLFCTGMA
jgi:hypothetical protein